MAQRIDPPSGRYGHIALFVRDNALLYITNDMR